MDSSSDGSFAWTDASSDTIDSTTKVSDKMNKTHSDDESVSGKSYKKQLQDELFAKSNGDVGEEPPHRPKERKRKRTECQSSTEQASPKKKKIKMEPESDIDVSTNKHKTNGHNISESYDESYLDLKVKAEEQFTSPSLGRTKKNKSQISTSSDVYTEFPETLVENFKNKSKDLSYNKLDTEDCKLDLLVQEEINQHEKKIKKKKKKSKKKEDSEIYNEVNNTDSQPEEDAINGSLGSPLLSLEEPEVDSIKNNIKIKNKNPNNSRDEDIARETQQDPSINAYNRRISERIQFEEDESLDMETSQLQCSKKSTRSSKLKTFLKNNVNLTPCTSQLTSESALTVDDEIWIVRCPKEVDIDAFRNKDLVLEGKCKLKLNSQTYEGVVDNESRLMSIFSSEQSNFVIKSLPVKGCLNLHKRIPKPHIQDDVLVGNQFNFIPLPETKCRHPLFGANYRKAIKLPTKVSVRLQAPSSAPPASSKKRSRSDQKSNQPNNDHLLSTPKTEPISGESVVPETETDQLVSSKKKKKKRKHLDCEEVTQKKKKRMKHDLESAEAWESEQAIEENLFNF